MNAYELADYMDDNIDAYYASEQKHLDNAANMLRQQADRIAELEKQGKPLAWMSPDGKVSQTEGRLFYIPLYTTPQTKPLSNDEIREIGDDCELKNNGILNWIDFARAIEERHGIK